MKASKKVYEIMCDIKDKKYTNIIKVLDDEDSEYYKEFMVVVSDIERIFITKRSKTIYDDAYIKFQLMFASNMIYEEQIYIKNNEEIKILFDEIYPKCKHPLHMVGSIKKHI